MISQNHFLALTSGSRFKGEQKTGNSTFKIEMKIDYINMDSGLICGTFKIFHLTHYYDLLTTYFEGSIVASYPKFELDEEDFVHLLRFPHFKKLVVNDFKTEEIKNSPFIYFKVKELFLLPDSSVETLPGASIDGQYYLCYYKKLACFCGFYHYANSCLRSDQHIILFHVDDNNLQSSDFV